MSVIYLSAVESIKKQGFEVWVPAFYHPNLPKEMLYAKPEPREKINRFSMVPTRRRGPMPMRPMHDPAQMQRACYPIEVMLDMFQKKIEFELAVESDVVIILDNLDWYLTSLKPDVELGDERSVAYAKLVIRWREEVYKHYFRYMKNNPNVLETLYPNNSLTNNLIHLMSSLGTRSENLELDPLRAKARPPYVIEDTTPKEKSEENSELFEMETSLGLGSADKFTNEGLEFDIGDFLSKG